MTTSYVVRTFNMQNGIASEVQCDSLADAQRIARNLFPWISYDLVEIKTTTAETILSQGIS